MPTLASMAATTSLPLRAYCGGGRVSVEVEWGGHARFLQQRTGPLRVVGVHAGQVQQPGVGRRGVAHVGLPSPSSTPSMKAWRSMACMMARRTRTSSSGLRLLMVSCPLPAVEPISTVKRLSAWNCLRFCSAAGHAVDVAGQQRRHLGGGVVDEAEGHLLQLHRRGIAIAVPFLERDRGALLPARVAGPVPTGLVAVVKRWCG